MSDDKHTHLPADDFQVSVSAEVEAIIEDYDLEGEPFDFDLFTKAAEHVLNGRGPGRSELQEELYWRAGGGTTPARRALTFKSPRGEEAMTAPPIREGRQRIEV